MLESSVSEWRRSISRALVWCAFVGTLVGAHVSQAAESPHPGLQAVLLKKALGYDKAFSGSADKPTLLLVANGNAQAVRELTSALKQASFDVRIVNPAALAASAASAQVVFLMDDATVDGLDEILSRHGLLSVASDPTRAERGEVAMAFGVRADSRPEIVVNLARVKKDRHEFRADFLKLVRVIR